MPRLRHPPRLGSLALLPQELTSVADSSAAAISRVDRRVKRKLLMYSTVVLNRYGMQEQR